MADSDKRGKQPEVPFGYEVLLTDAQRNTLDRYRNKGWSLHFMRRPIFLKPTVVLTEPDTGKSWIILDDGSIEPFTETRKK